MRGKKCNLRMQIFAKVDPDNLDSPLRMLQMGFDGSSELDPSAFANENGTPNKRAVTASSQLLAKALLKNIEIADMSGVMEKKEIKDFINETFKDLLEIK